MAPLDRAAAQGTADFSFTKTASPTTYSAVGDVITYTYTLINTGTEGLFNVEVTDNRVPPASISCSGTTMPSAGGTITCTGTYAITSGDIAAASVTNTATAFAESDGFGNPTRTAQATVTFVPPEEEEEVELFDPRPQTAAVIERFLHHRLTALFNDEPDRPRFIRRFPGSLWGNGPASPFNVAASETGGQVAFSTSLSQMRQAVASAGNGLDNQAMTVGSQALYGRPGPSPYTGLDIWTEAHFTSYDDVGGADGDFNILYVGADYPVTANWLIGILGQFDWTDENTKADGSKADGDGWMVGPYISGRLTDNLFFDWRAAWGTSDNGVNPFGTYSDSFDTDRWLTTARLTGNWTSGSWRLTPSVAVKYGEEDQDAYTDSLGFRIVGQDISLGQVEFGPEVAYRWLLADGTLVEPQLALYGVWNFDDGKLVVNDTVFSPDDFTGRLEGGVLVYLPRGWSFRGAAAYDGIGADFEAVTGKVWLNLPLN